MSGALGAYPPTPLWDRPLSPGVDPEIGNQRGPEIVVEAVEVPADLLTERGIDLEDRFEDLYVRDYEAMVRLAVLLVDSRDIAAPLTSPSPCSAT